MKIREIEKDPDKYLNSPDGFDYFNDYKDTKNYLLSIESTGPHIPRIIRRLDEGIKVWDLNQARKRDYHPTVGQFFLDRLKCATKLWEEDDARPPGAEKSISAWKRLFGPFEIPLSKNSEQLKYYADMGDCFYYEDKNGRVLLHDCTGSSIHQLPKNLIEP